MRFITPFLCAAMMAACATSPHASPPELARVELHAESSPDQDAGNVSVVAVVAWLMTELAFATDVSIEWPYVAVQVDAAGFMVLAMSANVETESICATLAIAGIDLVLALDENCEATAHP